MTAASVAKTLTSIAKVVAPAVAIAVLVAKGLEAKNRIQAALKPPK